MFDKHDALLADPPRPTFVATLRDRYGVAVIGA